VTSAISVVLDGGADGESQYGGSGGDTLLGGYGKASCDD
jgi:hypothetical protein